MTRVTARQLFSCTGATSMDWASSEISSIFGHFLVSEFFNSHAI
jgi:hypothetical protein